MPQSQANVLVHLVFSTKDRFPLLTDASVRKRVYAYVAAVLHACDCPALEIGGTGDHIHAVVSLSRNRTIAEIAREAKANSTGMAKTLGGMLSKFAWQGGYGAFSVHPSQLEAICAYVRNQEQHHHRRTFQEEYVALLREYNITFNEKYLWE